MGCDIHLFLEVKKGENWESADVMEKNPYHDPTEDDGEPEFVIKSIYSRRNYNVFCALCGVRSFAFDPEPTYISDPKGLPYDVSEIVKGFSDVYGSDGHSHNWNTLEELKAYDFKDYGETVEDFLEAVIPKMEAQNVSPDKVRIVYFFDN